MKPLNNTIFLTRGESRGRDAVPVGQGGEGGRGGVWIRRVWSPSAWVGLRTSRSVPSLCSVLNERVSQTSAVVTRSQPPKPASLRDAGFAAPCGDAGMWLLRCPCVAL